VPARPLHPVSDGRELEEVRKHRTKDGQHDGLRGRHGHAGDDSRSGRNALRGGQLSQRCTCKGNSFAFTLTLEPPLSGDALAREFTPIDFVASTCKHAYRTFGHCRGAESRIGRDAYPKPIGTTQRIYDLGDQAIRRRDTEPGSSNHAYAPNARALVHGEHRFQREKFAIHVQVIRAGRQGYLDDGPGANAKGASGIENQRVPPQCLGEPGSIGKRHALRGQSMRTCQCLQGGGISPDERWTMSPGKRTIQDQTAGDARSSIDSPGGIVSVC
jgi:hypothetical protein